MLEKIDIENVLFLDIETVPAFAEYSQLDERMKKLWNKKSERLNSYTTAPDEAQSPE